VHDVAGDHRIAPSTQETGSPLINVPAPRVVRGADSPPGGGGGGGAPGWGDDTPPLPCVFWEKPPPHHQARCEALRDGRGEDVGVVVAERRDPRVRHPLIQVGAQPVEPLRGQQSGMGRLQVVVADRSGTG
jgi:hypothetical protein